MIYCVVPPNMVGDLLEPLKAHYESDPDVTVIVDRRKAERRGPRSGEAGARELRDRRRRRPGSLPTLVSGE